MSKQENAGDSDALFYGLDANKERGQRETEEKKARVDLSLRRAYGWVVICVYALWVLNMGVLAWCRSDEPVFVAYVSSATILLGIGLYGLSRAAFGKKQEKQSSQIERLGELIDGLGGTKLVDRLQDLPSDKYPAFLGGLARLLRACK